MALTLQQQQSLQTKLSPTQIQVVRLLELPSVELQQRINEELQENPALEEGAEYLGYNESENESENEEYRNPLQNEDFNYDDYVNDDDTPDYQYQAHNYSPDDELPEQVVISGSSLLEHLKSQVYLTNMSKPERHIAKWVLGNIDDDGYLRRTTEQLVDDIAFQENIMVTDAQMQHIVDTIKTFDPAGVAAYDLRECLIIQLKQKAPNEAVTNALKILERCFEDFSKRHFAHIQERQDWTDEQLKEAIDEILHLNQKPANGFTGSVYERQQSTIIPDFFVENRDGELVVGLNTGDIPELHVSTDYKDMLAEYSSKQMANSKEGKETVRFIKQKIDSAQWFIDAIKQRNETLMSTMKAIVSKQKDFFLEGDDSCLRPMVLQDIANVTGYDVSTISRVSNSKYVDTEFGIFSLKHFFSESMTNDKGEEVSTREIKNLLGQLINEEDKSAPLTDDQLVTALAGHGYPIARRTIAKYRDQLGIPTARLRKRL
ncbi:MAG: RNA polymerase factor sigma-54 [Paludibacteraceae bacterium]|nr:RNA polymerase factor sigma-54 [Paludibacteraceae bacterium]